MTTAELSLYLHRETQRRQYRVLHRQLAAALALKAHISPDANYLVPTLGQPGDRNNLEALGSWIATDMDIVNMNPKDALDHLYKCLARCLAS